jgi:hypothetical protein
MARLALGVLDDPEGASVRVHGNGFLQVDLDGARRLHVWDPGLPRQAVPTPIHDHRFSFTSAVVVGTLGHFTYSVVPDLNGYHRVYCPEARDGEDTLLAPRSGLRVTVRTLGELWVPEGGSYDFGAGLFHETRVRALAVTLMEKTEVFNLRARVLCPVGMEPDNRFNRNDWRGDAVVQSAYWEAIDRLRALRGTLFEVGGQ